MTHTEVTPEKSGVCPFPHAEPAGPAADGRPVIRPRADRIMRRILFISDKPNTTTDDQVYRLFSTSILISATRCLLSYVIFPIFAPAIERASGAGPAVGLVVGVVALVFDVLSIRRFWLSEHRWRWLMTVVYVCVIGLVSTLLVHDITHLLR